MNELGVLLTGAWALSSLKGRRASKGEEVGILSSTWDNCRPLCSPKTQRLTTRTVADVDRRGIQVKITWNQDHSEVPKGQEGNTESTMFVSHGNYAIKED